MATVTEVTLVFTLPYGQVLRPSFFIGYPGSDTAVVEGDLDAVAAAANTAVSTSGLMAGYTNGVTYRRAQAQNFHIAPPGTEQPPPNPNGKLVADTIAFSADTGDIAGSRAVDTAPPPVTLIYLWKSTTAGPSGRNWSNWPPVGEDEIDSGGTLDSTRKSQLDSDILAVITAAAAAPAAAAELVQVSRVDNQLRAVAQQGLQTKTRGLRSTYTVPI